MSSKISGLASGSPIQPGDLFPIARGGANYTITGGDLKTLAAAGSSIESRYTQALYYPAPPRMPNALMSFGSRLWDADFLGSMTSADLYDTNAGYLTTGASTAKALMVYAQIANDPTYGMADYGLGGSVLIQHAFQFPSLSSNVELFGNLPYGSDNTGGLNAYVSTAGALVIGNGLAGSFGAQVNFFTGLTINTMYYLTTLWDGMKRDWFSWLNGVPTAVSVTSRGGANSGAPTLPGGVTALPAGFSLMIGAVAPNNGTTVSTAATLLTKAFRLSSVPAGRIIRNPQLLDIAFNQNPLVRFSDYDIVGGV